jgi:ADP-ribose pyrophosphatase YjhB (NUDIX family)
MSPQTDASDRIRGHALTLLAVAQNGLTYADDPFDRQRYGEVRRCAEGLMSLISDCGVEELHAYAAAGMGHMTPKVSVRGAIFNAEHEVLLVQERADGSWTLPGGWCEVLESPSQAVAKEVREEAGLVVDVEKLVAVLDRDKQRGGPSSLYHVHQMFFLCRPRHRVAPDLTETTAIEWFSLDALPPLSPSVLEEQIRLVYAHWLNPALATVFD